MTQASSSDISKAIANPYNINTGMAKNWEGLHLANPYCSVYAYIHLFLNNVHKDYAKTQVLYPTNHTLTQQWLSKREATNATFSYEEVDKTPFDIIAPLSAIDYFKSEGVNVSDNLLQEETIHSENLNEEDSEQALLVMMSFAEWLHYMKIKSLKAKEEEDDKKALKNRWRKEKLAAALEDEADDIPDQVYEMALNSIAPQEGMVSEALAEVYSTQGKYDKAIDMYKKLSLQNPKKSTYFARKIELLQKEIK